MNLKLSLALLLVCMSLGSQTTGQQDKMLLKDEDITLQEVEPFLYCCLPHKGPMTDIKDVIGQLMSAMHSQNIYPAGPMLGVYYDSPDKVKAEDLKWDVGFPITVQVLPQAPLMKKQWIFKTVVAAVHVGPYEKGGEAIEKMLKWMEHAKYVPAGPILEKYLDMDPSQVKPEELRTEIWIPCQKSEK
jgi:DNA gyrase inhibitor GyrI